MMKRVLYIINIIIVVLPLLVLAGWQFDIRGLKQPVASSVVMNPVTAISILLSGLSFWLIALRPVNLRVSRFLACLVLATGFIKLVSVFTGIGVGIDTMLFKERLLADPSNYKPNTMAPNAAFAFVLYGIALLLLTVQNQRARKLANYFSLPVLIISLFSIIGYLYHVKAYYGLPSFYPMAIHTALCLLIMSIAVPLYNNKAAYMVILSSNNIAGRVARLLIPATIVVPIMLGFVRLYAQWHIPISVELGVSLLIISVILAFFSLTWYVALALNKADMARVAAEEELKRKNKILSATEERLRLALDGSAAGIWDWEEIRTDNFWWSPRFYELLGYSDKEIKLSLDTFRNMMHPDDVPRNVAVLDESISNRSRYAIEYRIKTKQGVYKWFSATGLAKFDEQGKAVRMVGSIIDIDEKKKADNILLAQSALIQIIPDAIIGMSLDLKITSWNKGAEALYGLTPFEAVGRGLYDIAVVQTSENTRLERLALLKQHGIVRSEVSLTTLAGRKVIILATTKLVKDAQDIVTGVVAIHTDITALKTNEERLQLATEGTSAGLWDWMDMNSDEEWWSMRFYELLGYSNNEIPALASTFREIMHPDDFGRIAKSLNAHFKHQSRFEIEARLKTKSGIYKWFLGTGQVTRNTEGVPVRMVGSIIDIDEQKKTRDNIEQQAALINMLPDGIVFYSKGMRFADINAGAEKMFDLKREDITGKNLNDFITFSLPSGEKFEDSLALLWQTGFYRNEIQITNKQTGKMVSVLVSIKKLENAYGGEPLFMAIYTDLTPLRINEELRQALKAVETNNQYLEQFAYLSAHDIKAPIITIAGLTELLTGNHAVKDEYANVLRMLTKSIGQIQRTNNALNEILKLRKSLVTRDAARPVGMTLRNIIEAVKAELGKEMDCAPIATNLNDLGDTEFNYTYLKIVFYNLLSNALKFHDPLRVLVVTLTATRTPNGDYRFIVEDNGLGFDVERNRMKLYGIFKRFHTHVEGSGVGLHMVKSITDEYNGSIEVQSEPGKGTRFVVDFNKNILA